MSKKTRKLQYTPTAGYLLVEPLEVTQVGEVDIKDDEQRPQRAKVLIVGKPTWYENSDRVFEAPCKVGDSIIHSSVGWENVTIEEEDFRLVPFNKVLMIKK